MLLIRADGNAKIGAGHLMRCLTIAEEVTVRQGSGETICFVCADGESAALAGQQGFRSRVLGTDYRDMESELGLWQEIATEKSVILVDSYYVTDRYLNALRQYGHVVLIDDLGTHRYPVDCVINYNVSASAAAYQELYQKEPTRLFIGSSYVPLRRQFLKARWVQETEVGHVLITTGGGDIGNIGGRILDRIYREDLVFHLIMGRFNPHFQKMKEREKDVGNLWIHHDVKDMAELMQRCDVALTAGGSTVYELAAVGVPFICFSYAGNQEALVEYIGKRHIAGCAGAWHKDAAKTLENLGRQFAQLVRDRERRIAYSSREREMIDGRGAARIAQVLTALGSGG